MRTFLIIIWLIACLAADSAAAKIPTQKSGPLNIFEVLKLAKESSDAITDRKIDKEAIAREIAEVQALAGDFEAAFKTVFRNHAYYSMLLASIVTAQAKAGNRTAALKTLDRIKVPSDRVTAYVGLAESHLLKGELKQADPYFNAAVEEASKVKSSLDRTKLLRTIAKAQTHAGDFAGAFLTIGTIPDKREKSRMLSKLALTHAGEKSIRMAFSVAESIPDEKIKFSTLGGIAEAQAAGDKAAAFKTARDIPSDYYRAEALTRIGAVQVKQDAKADARSTFHEARQIARSMNEEDFDRAMLLKSIGEAQAKADPAAAIQTLQQAKQAAQSLKEEESYEKAIALQAVAEALWNAGDDSGAENAFQEARQASLDIKQDPYYRAAALVTIAKAELDAGNRGAAVQTLQLAFRAAQEVPTASQKAITLVDIANAQALAEDPSAPATLQRAEQQIPEIKDELEQLAIVIMIAVAHLRHGFIKAALEMADEVPKEEQKADILNKITEAQVQQGDLEEAVETALEQNSPLVRAKALLGVARGMLEIKSAEGMG